MWRCDKLIARLFLTKWKRDFVVSLFWPLRVEGLRDNKWQCFTSQHCNFLSSSGNQLQTFQECFGSANSSNLFGFFSFILSSLSFFFFFFSCLPDLFVAQTPIPIKWIPSVDCPFDLACCLHKSTSRFPFQPTCITCVSSSVIDWNNANVNHEMLVL